MAELRIHAFRMPEGSQDERDIVIQGLTDKQATDAASGVRYWLDREEDLVILAVPIMGAQTQG